MRKFKDILSTYKKEPKNLLRQAISDNDYAFIQEFLNNSYFDINEVDENYHTILDYACMYRRISIMRLLISKKARLGILFYKINNEKDFITKISDLKAAGYDLNSIDKLGFAPMHYASSMAFTKAVKKLIDFKVKVLQTSISGETPVKSALKKPHVGIFIGQA